MERFVVFDVETPNRKSNRISAIGINVIEDCKITDEFYSLVNPETSFDYFNTMITGIDEDLVQNSPTFPEIWKKIKSYFENSIIVAHNAIFDLSVLKSCLNDYEIFWKEKVEYLCTVQIGRKFLPNMSHRLNVMCDYYGIDLNHHRADSDSHACAEILLNYIKNGIDVEIYKRTYYLKKKSLKIEL